MSDYIFKGFCIFIIAGAIWHGIGQMSGQAVANSEFDEAQLMSVQSQPTPTVEYVPPVPRDNQRMTVQVNDWLSVEAVCVDGSPAVVDSTYPNAVVFVCE